MPIAEGETLYAYYLGAGADNAGLAYRLRGDELILPKEWAVPRLEENARLRVFTDPAAGSGTHCVYGK